MRTVSLECPNCHRPYAMLAVDTKGRYHYVNEYLTGYCPPAHFPAGISRLNEMLLIWNSVVRGMRYVPDSADGNEDNDAWQTAAETQQLGTGDCEDSSILLADWLIARGFEARVALGHYAERGGHAWVIVRLEAAPTFSNQPIPMRTLPVRLCSRKSDPAMFRTPRLIATDSSSGRIPARTGTATTGRRQNGSTSCLNPKKTVANAKSGTRPVSTISLRRRNAPGVGDVEARDLRRAKQADMPGRWCRCRGSRAA